MKKLFFINIFFIISCSLFFFDVSCIHFFETFFLSSLLCFYTLHVHPSWLPPSLKLRQTGTWLGFLLFLLSLETLITNGTFWLASAYLIPLTLISWKAQTALAPKNLLPYLFLSLCLISHDLLAQALSNQAFSMPNTYTIGKITANIVCIWFLSLKFSSHGTQGNRY